MNHRPSRNRFFFVYSSRNKAGGRPHPIVDARRDMALTMYWQHRTIEEIAAELNVHIDTIRAYIRRARRQGDIRAMRRRGQKRSMMAQARAKRIVDLAATGLTANEIANRVNCHVRLVQIRLKEKADG